MHRCYPQCKPEIGYHHSESSQYNAEQQLKNHVKSLEKSLQKARDAAGMAPDPSNYNIKDVFEYGDYKVLLVQYPNCTNFDGMKVIVSKCGMLDLLRMKRLDPHFTKVVHKDSVPIIARFPPSDEGIEMAKDLASALQEGRLKKKVNKESEVKRFQDRSDW